MQLRSFRKNIFLMLVLLPLAVSSSGCVYLVVGGIGALGGYIASPDTVEGIHAYSTKELWEATGEIVAIMGLILEEQKEGGMLLAKINGAKVTVMISTVGDNMTKISIKARKAFMPRISVAQDVYVKVIGRVKSGKKP